MPPWRAHRRQVRIVFCDLRGFTAFAETAEPEEVMAVMQEYHASLGCALERFVGDGLMVIFGGRDARPPIRILQQLAAPTPRARVRRRDSLWKNLAPLVSKGALNTAPPGLWSILRRDFALRHATA